MRRLINIAIFVLLGANFSLMANGLGYGVFNVDSSKYNNQNSPQTMPQDTTLAINSEIENTLNYKLTGSFKDKIKALYQLNQNLPFWVGDNNTQNFSQLLRALDNPYFNYLGKNLNRKEIKYLSFSIDNGSIDKSNIDTAKARLDVLMSDSYFKLLHFLRYGDTNWDMVKAKLKHLKEQKDIRATWEINPRELPSVDDIFNSLKSNQVIESIKDAIPYPSRYNNLIAMLQKYKKMPRFRKIVDGQLLKRGKSDSKIAQIKRVLKFFGDYPKNRIIDNYYDKALSKAIIKFKKRMNLNQGDYIDNKTIYYLNLDRNYYLKSIISTLEILKLYPHKMEDTRVEVNIPEFKMRFYQNNQVAYKSDVIVGRIDRPTPIFKSQMSYMVLNPTWTIPDNLIKRDLIPALKAQPNYLQDHDIHVYTSYSANAPEVELDLQKLFSYKHSDKKVPYRFVQFPSPKNALGRVKFMFPNRYSVYLHDTDNKSLFKYRYRVFSSGCMRIKKPFDLMDMLLPYAKGNYDESKIENILDSNKPTEIVFRKKIPIYTTYFIASRENGKDMFFYDIYMYAQIVWESMNGHIKSSFTIPKKRLITIKQTGSRIYIERHR